MTSSPDLARLERALKSRYHVWRIYTEEDRATSVLSHLQRALPHIDPSEWEERFDFGGVYVNGLAAEPHQALPLPCKIEYYEPKFPLHLATEIFPQWKNDFIIFEDEYLLACFKPPGLPCLPGMEQRRYNLKKYLEAYSGVTVHFPSRIDVSASGLVLVSKSPLTHNALQKHFVRRTVSKRYRLETASLPAWDTCINTKNITEDPAHPVLRRADSIIGRSARTEFSVLSRCSASCLIEARPISGRTHQIRVHSADLGIPISGDNFYGGSEAPELRLLSFSAVLPHPYSAEALEITVPSRLYPAWLQRF